MEYRQSDVGMLTKVANELGIPWYCVGDDDDNRAKEERKLKANLAGARESNRFAFPYPNMEEHLKANGYAEVYRRYRKKQKTRAAAEMRERVDQILGEYTDRAQASLSPRSPPFPRCTLTLRHRLESAPVERGRA